MNRHVIAVLAAMVFSIPATAQQPARKVGEQDQRCQFDRDRHRERDRSGDPNPYATRAGAPNPYATRAGDPNPYATKVGTPTR